MTTIIRWLVHFLESVVLLVFVCGTLVLAVGGGAAAYTGVETGNTIAVIGGGVSFFVGGGIIITWLRV